MQQYDNHRRWQVFLEFQRGGQRDSSQRACTVDPLFIIILCRQIFYLAEFSLRVSCLMWMERPSSKMLHYLIWLFLEVSSSVLRVPKRLYLRQLDFLVRCFSGHPWCSMPWMSALRALGHSFWKLNTCMDNLRSISGFPCDLREEIARCLILKFCDCLREERVALALVLLRTLCFQSCERWFSSSSADSASICWMEMREMVYSRELSRGMSVPLLLPTEGMRLSVNLKEISSIEGTLLGCSDIIEIDDRIAPNAFTSFQSRITLPNKQTDGKTQDGEKEEIV